MNSCLRLVAEEFPLASIQCTVCQAALASDGHTLTSCVHRRKLKDNAHMHTHQQPSQLC